MTQDSKSHCKDHVHLVSNKTKFLRVRDTGYFTSASLVLGATQQMYTDYMKEAINICYHTLKKWDFWNVVR